MGGSAGYASALGVVGGGGGEEHLRSSARTRLDVGRRRARRRPARLRRPRTAARLLDGRPNGDALPRPLPPVPTHLGSARSVAPLSGAQGPGSSFLSRRERVPRQKFTNRHKCSRIRIGRTAGWAIHGNTGESAWSTVHLQAIGKNYALG